MPGNLLQVIWNSLTFQQVIRLSPAHYVYFTRERLSGMNRQELTHFSESNFQGFTEGNRLYLESLFAMETTLPD